MRFSHNLCQQCWLSVYRGEVRGEESLFESRPHRQRDHEQLHWVLDVPESGDQQPEPRQGILGLFLLLVCVPKGQNDD